MCWQSTTSLFGRLGLVSVFLLSGCGTGVPLVDAAFRGDEQKVRKLMDAGADIEQVGLGMTAIESAAMKGNDAVVEILLDKHAKPGMAPFYAGNNGHAQTLRVLAGHGVLIDPMVAYGAVSNNHDQVLKVCLESPKVKSQMSRIGSDLLVTACQRSYVPNVKLLIAAGVDVNRAGRVTYKVWDSQTKLNPNSMRMTSEGYSFQMVTQTTESDVTRSGKPIQFAMDREVRRILQDAGARTP